MRKALPDGPGSGEERALRAAGGRRTAHRARPRSRRRPSRASWSRRTAVPDTGSWSSCRRPGDVPAPRRRWRRRRRRCWRRRRLRSRAKRPRSTSPVKTLSVAAASGRDLVIAIDAGHGGQDPGRHRPRRHAREGRHARDRPAAGRSHRRGGRHARRADPRRRLLHHAARPRPQGARSSAPTCSSRSTPTRCRTASVSGVVGVRAVAARRVRRGRRAGSPSARTRRT